MKTVILILATLLPALSFASTYVVCGKHVDSEMRAAGYELEISSEDDAYSGSVGKSWNLKLQENGDWLSANKNITAKKTELNDVTIIAITLVSGRSVSGAVGTVYKLIDLYSERPVLEKYSMGGFVGSQKIGTYECMSGND